ncbi:hypothetical protein ACTA71_000540 [Dictyostelium dimigraforme]
MVEKVKKTVTKTTATLQKKTITKPTTATTTTTTTSKPISKSTTTTATNTTTTKPISKNEKITIVNKKENNENDKFKIGNKIEVCVKEIRDFEVITNFESYIGKLHVCNIPLPSKEGESVLNSIKKGNTIICYIVSVEHTAKIMTLSMFEQLKPQTKQFKIGQQIDAIVYGLTSVNEITCWISPTQVGTIEIISNFKNIPQFKQFKEKNTFIKCLVKSIGVDNKIYLSIGKESISNEKIKVGDIMIGLIKEIGNISMKIQLYNNLSGEIRLIDINDELRTNPLSIYKTETLIMVCVKSIGKEGILLSTYKSLLGLKTWEMNPKYKHPRSIKRSIKNDFIIGAQVWGFVIEKTNQIIRVELKGQLIAILQVEDVGPFLLSSCDVGRLVRVVIASEPTIEGSSQIVKAHLHLDKTAPTPKTIKIDDILPLEIVDIKNYGLFVKNRKVSGLAHISQLDDEPIDPEQIDKLYSLGEFVLGKCIGKERSKEKGKTIFQFTLKPEHFQSIDMEQFIKCSWDQEDPIEEVFQPIKPIKTISTLPIKSFLVELNQLLESSKLITTTINNKQNKLETIEEEDEEKEIKDQNHSGGDDDDDNDEFKSTSLISSNILSKKRKDIIKDNDEIDEDEITDSKKKQKTEKNKNKNKQEQEIQEREDLLANNNVAPEGPQDFERMILGTPNSSYIWIKFMSHYLGLSEISKAREIGERAIKKIIPSEVLEQRNIWIAMYNLENLYGTPDSLLKLFQRSIQYQDPKTMYLTIINILENTGKFERTEEYFKMLFKKDGKHSAKVWCRYGEFLLKCNNIEVFNSILSRALEILPKKKQIKVINKFAQLEYKLGDIERGRTIFEGLVSNYPNRTDIWNIYLDMELRDKDAIKSSKELKDKIRTLFNRTIALKVSDRNIKQFFKRFLQFEKEFGSNFTTNEVKKLAIKFVESNN